MEFGQTGKTLLAAVFLAVVMFAVFVAGQMNPVFHGHGLVPTASSVPVNNYFPRGSEDGRFDSKCVASTLYHKTVCGVPFARLIAFPERYHQSVIAVTGFLAATGPNRQSLYPSEDSYRNMGEYERVEIGTGIPDTIRAKLAGGVWVRVIGEFDGTYAGQPWGLGAIYQVMDIAEARPDVSPVAAPPKVAARATAPLGVPVAATALLPQTAPPAARLTLRSTDPAAPASSPPPTSPSPVADPPKVALRTPDAASVATAPPTPLPEAQAAAH